MTRGRFSFTGEGDTGSPRSRLRARDTGVGVFGTFLVVSADSASTAKAAKG